MRLSRVAALAIVLFVITVPAAASAAPDLVVTSVVLPLHGVMSETAVHDMQVDAADGRIFITGTYSGKVVELSLSGKILATAKVPGAGDIAVVGSSIYVGSCTTGTVTKLSISGLVETASFTVSSGMPCNMVALAGKLWFTTTNNTSTLESVRIASPHTTATYPSISAGVFAAVPPSTLYTGSYGADTLVKLDVSGGTPTVTASTSNAVQTIELSVTPDGSHVISSEAGYSFLFDSSLNDLGPLQFGQGESVYSPDGQSIGDGFNGFDVLPTGSTTPTMTVNLPEDYSQHDTDSAHHIAFSPDSSQLYVAGTTTGDYTQSPTTGELFVVEIPQTPSYTSTIGGLCGCTWATVGNAGEVDGTIATDPTGGQSGRTVDAELTDPNGNPVSATGVTTDASGNFAVQTPSLDVAGTWKVHLTLEPFGDYRGASADTTIHSIGALTNVTLSRSAASVVYGSHETLTAQLSTYAAGETVVRIHRVSTSGTDTLIGSGTVDATGAFTLTFSPQYNASYYAEHQGDSAYDPATSAKTTVNVIPAIIGKWSTRHGTSGQYATFRYHGSCAGSGISCPLFTEHVRPTDAGHTALLIVQQDTASGWKTVAVYKHKLNRRSSWTFKIRYPNSSVIDKKLRLIAATKKTTQLAASAWGYWYFKIT
jgi:hypothetical protein